MVTVLTEKQEKKTLIWNQSRVSQGVVSLSHIQCLILQSASDLCNMMPVGVSLVQNGF